MPRTCELISYWNLLLERIEVLPTPSSECDGGVEALCVTVKRGPMRTLNLDSCLMI